MGRARGTKGHPHAGGRAGWVQRRRAEGEAGDEARGERHWRLSGRAVCVAQKDFPRPGDVLDGCSAEELREEQVERGDRLKRTGGVIG